MVKGRTKFARGQKWLEERKCVRRVADISNPSVPMKYIILEASTAVIKD